MTLVLGFGAAALVDTGKDSQIAKSSGNLASPLLAQAVGGGEGTLGGAVLLALDLGRRFRDHPGRGRRADPDLGFFGGARPLRQRVQEGQGLREVRAARRPDRRVRHRHRSPSCSPFPRSG